MEQAMERDRSCNMVEISLRELHLLYSLLSSQDSPARPHLRMFRDL